MLERCCSAMAASARAIAASWTVATFSASSFCSLMRSAFARFSSERKRPASHRGHAAAVYNAETLEMLAEFMRERGSR